MIFEISEREYPKMMAQVEKRKRLIASVLKKAGLNVKLHMRKGQQSWYEWNGAHGTPENEVSLVTEILTGRLGQRSDLYVEMGILGYPMDGGKTHKKIVDALNAAGLTDYEGGDDEASTFRFIKFEVTTERDT